MTREFLDKLCREHGNYGLSELMSDTRWVIPENDANVKPVAPLSDRYAKFYNHILAEARQIDPRARVIAYAYTNGMMGCSYDSMRGSWSSRVMMTYALTRAFRDPLHGYDRAREEVLSAFGPAREAVGRYLDAVYENTTRWSFAEVRKIAWANANGRHSGGSFGACAAILAEFFEDSFFPGMNSVLDDAVRAAKGDKEIISRVEFLRKGLKDAELTRVTRVRQKAWLADSNDTAKKAAFEAAFKVMNDYRAEIENDCVANYKVQSFRELSSMGWPHKTLNPK